MVTGLPFSTFIVLTVTVPLVSSSVPFKTDPQLKLLVVIALILGTDVEITRVCAADATDTFPAGSVAFAVIV